MMMKKCCNHKRPDRASHVMGVHHDIKKLMSAKANKAATKPVKASKVMEK